MIEPLPEPDPALEMAAKLIEDVRSEMRRITGIDKSMLAPQSLAQASRQAWIWADLARRHAETIDALFEHSLRHEIEMPLQTPFVPTEKGESNGS